MSDREIEAVKRARDRIRDLLFDHTVDLAYRIAGCQLTKDPMRIADRLEAELKEVQAALDGPTLGIFEQLEVWMDLIDKLGI